jgi:hypothetical protein
MDFTRRAQLIKQQSVARRMLSRIQNFIDVGDKKINKIQVRYSKLVDIFNRYDIAQSELEISDDADHISDRELFENQYYQVEAKFNELLHPVVDSHSRINSPPSSVSEQGNSVHSSSSHIRLPTIALPNFDCDTCSWLHFRDTFEALVVNNATLSNVQRFHCIIASLKNEAKDLISNLQITNENFLVAWQLVTQRYNNTRLIAMMHSKNLCQMPPSQKGRRIITAPNN